MVITPVVPALPERLPDDFLSYALLGASEALIGLAMGFVMTLAFAAVQLAGEIMDMLSGFALVNVFNPALETQVPIFGFFYFILAALYLLVVDGHHLMIEHMAATFHKIPLGSLVLHPELAAQVSLWGSAMFVDSLLIAAPVGGALLFAYLTMGFMGRVVPQINLFVVGFPITVGLGLLTTALIIEVYLLVLDGVFDRMWVNVAELVEGMT